MRIIGDGGHAAVVREVVGAMDVIYDDGWCFIAVGDNRARRKEARAHEHLRFPTLRHPSAVVSPSAKIGEGTIIMAGAIVAAQAVVGRHCILNHGSTTDHHCHLGDFVHIAPGAHLCGNVTVEDGALIGVGAVAVPGACIRAWTLVEAGSVAK